ncbi:MAG: anti-sigma factor [Anaerolineaceae bacterium]
MKDDMTELIDLYLDGETGPLETRKIEDHLLKCEDCSKIVAQRRRLSELIQAHPRVVSSKSDRQFAREVMDRINHQPETTRINVSSLEPGWIGIPLVLVVGLTFIQAVWVESSVVRFIPQVREVLDPNQFLLPFSFALPSEFIRVIEFLPGLNLWSWPWSSAVVISAALGVLYVSWLAGWWVKSQKRANA